MENNSIDKTFNEASKTLEEPATFPGFDKVWAKVEEKLDRKEEKKSKIVPIWFPYGIAASLLIGSAIFYFSGKKEKAEVTQQIIAKNIISENKPSVVISEHIQKADSTIKANIQKETLPPVTMAAEAPHAMIAAPLPVISSVPAASPAHGEKPEIPEKIDKIIQEVPKNQNTEVVIAMGIKKEKASMVNSLDPSSSLKKKLTDLNAVADTAEAVYSTNPYDLKESSQEPEILAYNKGYLQAKQSVAGNYQGLANKIGNKEAVNSIRGAASGVNINSISGRQGSGKVDISISCEGSSKTNNSPLFVINGKATDSELFKRIDPKKIESIRVFKADTATALFGNQAANGAVLVETKDISRKEKRMLKRLLKKEKLLKK
ncbi:TonB-dependent receptor plug domain-containing protein [Chryseobacterium gambrini]|uniref:TonB-dependent receptor plug domain-containing protein n=1 Tax=Chryseobacterium gambrini TaxID=373672 RepID=A0AAJ1VPB7_9FLAO|nr:MULTISPECIES: TonB-dependent receptor plug domain-containing protein [Chryseobacterium]MDN4014824.1 TonB-dependent receptor plug domain-containing protein [Chryseobacterium gambrini]MDN4027987.1 TonB-dependent receptor plug domain-containing protein [Chryseobacterium gambrini]QWA39707.1 TonB-dependent receptor plug domain-containing protein [Chryseobacterium sp. ZHDP1]